MSGILDVISMCFLCIIFSPYQDGFIVIHVPTEYDTVIESVFKTEFITLLSSKYEAALDRKLRIDFNTS